jgi:hypothetical protein
VKFIRYSDDGRAALYEHSDGSRFYWHLKRPRAIDIQPTNVWEKIRQLSTLNPVKPRNDHIHW